MSLYCHQMGTGPPLVLLHGWGMNAAVWRPLLSDLAQCFGVHAIELPGHGASPVASAASLAEWAASCTAVAPPRAHWVGWSLGGQVALRAALDEPTRISGLSLVATTPRFVQAADWPCAMPADSLHGFADALADDPEGTLRRFLGLQVRGTAQARDTLRTLHSELAERPPGSHSGLAQGLALLLQTDLRAELGRLACPSHWLFGSRDTLVPQAVRERVRALLPKSDCVLFEGAGHAPFLSHRAAGLTWLTRNVSGAVAV